MKYRSKQALTDDMVQQYATLGALLESVPVASYHEPGVWGDEWNVHDLVAHLFEWQQLFLTWYDAGAHGLTPAMPAPGYRWGETPRLNRAIRERYRHHDPQELLRQLDAAHRRLLALAESLSEPELLAVGHFGWTGSSTLATYLSASTASHYRFATRVLKRWVRGPRTGRAPGP